MRYKKINKEILPSFTVVTMCGKHHVQMLKECLYSLIRSWELAPEIKIYSDGTITIDELKKQFRWLGDRAKVVLWEEVIPALVEDKQTNLIQFAKNHVIGKKLAIIITNGKEKPVLWVDTDILWYRQLPFGDLEEMLKKTIYIKATSDYQPAYSDSLYKSSLTTGTYINTGIVFLQGDLLKSIDLSKEIETAAFNPDHFSEQTILAIAINALGRNVWNLEEIACHQSDHLTLKPTYIHKEWIARHYVGPVRHLFWRDALFMRLGVQP